MTKEKIFELACIIAGQEINAIDITKEDQAATVRGLIVAEYNEIIDAAGILNIPIVD